MADRPAPRVTIVTYHYVRPLAGSRFPKLPALDLAAFRGQLQYIRRHYSPIRLADVVAAAHDRRPLPPRPLVLTFDDGYRDHYNHVCPLLADAGVPGTFFPVRSALVGRTMLDVNKIQFVIAAAGGVDALVDAVDRAVETPRDYRARWWKASRFDPAPVVYVKRMLQHALPEAVRAPLVRDLFRRTVTHDDDAFAGELYFTVGEARAMRAAGMEFGGHADRHIPLPELSSDEQAQEIDGALESLDVIGVPRREFVYSYVKGAFDPHSIEALRSRGCGAAVTTTAGLARVAAADLLTLPRLDTNDLPVDADAQINEWTARALP